MLYDNKKLEHKQKIDQGKAFGKSFNYEYGREKAKKIAEGKSHLKGQHTKVLNKFRKK